MSNILTAVFSFDVLIAVGVARLLFLASRVRKIPALPPKVAAAKAVLTRIIKPKAIASVSVGGVECLVCHHKVARYTPSAAGPVCVNCKPL